VGLIALSVLGGVLIAPGLAEQIDQLLESLPPALERIQASVGQYEWLTELLERTPDPIDLIDQPGMVIEQATGIFSTTFGAILRFLIILISGIYFAVDPRLYTRGLLRLVPVPRRPRAREVLHELGDTLWWWLIGRFISMASVGVMIGVGLWLLGVPLAFTLGFLAALLHFIPNIGPWLAAFPAVLLALLHSPQQALYVAILYLVIQQIESYLITPLVQQRAVKLAPVVSIFAQVLLTLTVGGIGLVLASPLAAVVQVLVHALCRRRAGRSIAGAARLVASRPATCAAGYDSTASIPRLVARRATRSQPPGNMCGWLRFNSIHPATRSQPPSRYDSPDSHGWLRVAFTLRASALGISGHVLRRHRSCRLLRHRRDFKLACRGEGS
jgi:predicted PurR-regulated permease PerM